MGRSSGTGHPHNFSCKKCKRGMLDRWPGSSTAGMRYDAPDFPWHRTGRTKRNPSNKRGGRSLGELHEFVCVCGHKGWTSHPTAEFFKLEKEKKREYRVTVNGKEFSATSLDDLKQQLDFFFAGESRRLKRAIDEALADPTRY